MKIVPTPMNKIELDFISDLTQDDHGIWEVFEFVQLHLPELSLEEVLEMGKSLLSKWLADEIVIARSGESIDSRILTTKDALLRIEEAGNEAVTWFPQAPWLQLGPKAQESYPWIDNDT
jgi:hypothetical protein